MASSFTRASPYLQQTAKQLATRDIKSWTYPLWAYVVGCIGVACVCLFNGYVTALIAKREVRKRSEKDLEAGVLEQVPTDGTFPDSMAKGPHMHDSSTIQSERKQTLSTKMKRVFQKFGKNKHDDSASVTVVGTSATNTTVRNSIGSDSKAPEVYREEVAHKDHIDQIAVSRPAELPAYPNDPDAITRADGEKVYEKE